VSQGSSGSVVPSLPSCCLWQPHSRLVQYATVRGTIGYGMFKWGVLADSLDLLNSRPRADSILFALAKSYQFGISPSTDISSLPTCAGFTASFQ